MPIPKDLYDQISHLVSENRINSAIELMEDQLPVLRHERPRQYKSVLLLINDFNKIQEKKINGLIIAEDESRKLSMRLLDVAETLEKPHDAPPPMSESPDPFRVVQPEYNAPPRVDYQALNNQAPAKSEGMSFGKIALYALAGLGGLALIGLLFTDDEYEDPYYEPQAVVESAGGSFSEPTEEAADEILPPPVAPAPRPQPAAQQPAQTRDPAPTRATPPASGGSSLAAQVRRKFGGTSWYSDNFGALYFNAEGNMASYDNGTSSLLIQGLEDDGRIFASFAEPTKALQGVVYLDVVNNGQQIEISVINMATEQVLPPFYLERQ